MPQHAFDRRRVEQVSAVHDRDAQAVCHFRRDQRDVELRTRQARSKGSHIDVAQLLAASRQILQNEHHLEQGIAAQVTIRLELFHQLFERQVLVRIRAHGGFPYPAQQLTEAGIIRQIGAHHQRVDEEADQLLDFGAIASGDRGADDHVLLAGVAREQHIEGRQQAS